VPILMKRSALVQNASLVYCDFLRRYLPVMLQHRILKKERALCTCMVQHELFRLRCTPQGFRELTVDVCLSAQLHSRDVSG